MPDMDGLHGDFRSRLEALVKASGGRVKIVSAARDSKKQAQLYADAVKRYGQKNARNWAAPPGHSYHEKGLAADLGGDLRLAAKLAPQFGLHFPLSNEDWHIEPIGAREGKFGDGGQRSGGGGGAPQGMTVEEEASQQQQIDPVAQQMGELQQLIMGDQTLPTVAGLPETGVPGLEQQVQAEQTQKTYTFEGQAGRRQPGAMQGGGAGGDEIDRFMAAIGGKESGNNYNARNKDSGAQGKYQIMPNNWPAWSKEAGLAGAARTPENQEKVARFKMQQYYNQFGNWRDVAIAWYGGPGAVKYKNKNASQGAYPSINKYADDIMRRMG